MFLIFSNFLISEVLIRLATRDATVYQVCFTRYQASFILWRIGTLLKYGTVLEYYEQDCSWNSILLNFDQNYS